MLYGCVFRCLVVFLLMCFLDEVESFSPSPHRITYRASWRPSTPAIHRSSGRSRIALYEAEEPQEDKPLGDDTPAKDATKLSLEEKMKNWEASEEEVRAATLGGVVPERTDSFDVGLYVAFPFMVIGCLLFLAFPFIADKIDVSSVGPPPTS